MARPIRIKVEVDGREVEREFERMENATEEFERALEQVDREADQAEDAIGDMARGADGSFDKMRRSADSAERTVDDLTDEASDSAREFGSAFRGDPVEALEEVQSLASNLAQRVIPGVGGAVLSIAGGVAFSALISFYEKWREQQEARREQINEWRDTLLDAFSEGASGLEAPQVLEGFTEQLDSVSRSWTDFNLDLSQTSPKVQQAFAKAFATGAPEDWAAAQAVANSAYEATTTRLSQTQGTWTDSDKAIRDVSNAVGTFGEDLVTAQKVAESYQAVLDEVPPTAEEVQEAHEDAADAVRDLGREFADSEQAADNYAQQVDDTAEAVKELTEGGTKPLADGLDTQTQAARDSRDELRALADSALDAAAAQVELDGDTDGARKTTEEARRQFIETATQLGLSEQAAGNYANQLGLVPSRVATQVQAPGLGATSQSAQALLDRLNDLDGKVVTTTIRERLVRTAQIEAETGRSIAAQSTLASKADVEPLDGDTVLRLRPVAYRYADETQRRVGFIAEEVAQVDKRLVAFRHGHPDGVYYDSITAPLVALVQRQQEQIDQLRRDLPRVPPPLGMRRPL